MSSNDPNAQPPAQVAAALAEAKRRAEIAKARTEAQPTFLVRADISFGEVFSLVFKVWLSLVILSVPVYVALYLLDVI